MSPSHHQLPPEPALLPKLLLMEQQNLSVLEKARLQMDLLGGQVPMENVEEAHEQRLR